MNYSKYISSNRGSLTSNEKVYSPHKSIAKALWENICCQIIGSFGMNTEYDTNENSSFPMDLFQF